MCKFLGFIPDMAKNIPLGEGTSCDLVIKMYLSCKQEAMCSISSAAYMYPCSVLTALDCSPEIESMVFGAQPYVYKHHNSKCENLRLGVNLSDL